MIEIDYSTSTTSATEDVKKLQNQRQGRKTFLFRTLELVKNFPQQKSYVYTKNRILKCKVNIHA